MQTHKKADRQIDPIPAGLVLEGGGMRGVYTAGALDFLMDQGLWFQHIYGVSAGACHGVSYVSRQRGRAIRTVLEHVNNWRYASLRSLVATGDYFGEQYVYRDIPEKYAPFDYETFAQSPMRLHTVLFNCRTGEAEYPVAEDMRRDMDFIRASSSLPFMARMVEIGGMPYMDGGIRDSIPIARSIAEGNRMNLIVLTQHRGYAKQESNAHRLARVRYRQYPALPRALSVRHRRYNDQLAACYREEQKGRAVIIQPRMPVAFRRIEKDIHKLEALYTQGYEDAARLEGDIRRLAEKGAALPAG